MRYELKYAQQRMTYSKVILEMLRRLSKVYFDEDNYGAAVPYMTLYAAILIGQVEDRPMNLTKLADYAGMPRGTAVRKLKELEGMNIVVRDGDKYYLNEPIVNGEEAVINVVKNNDHLITLGIELSKMDSLLVAPREIPD